MYHYIYKVTCPSGKYYIGRHSTKKKDDNYVGSGKWVRSLKDKSKLTKEILEVCDDPTVLLEKEKYYISLFMGKDGCMNFNNNPVGFSSGSLNCSTTPEEKIKRRLRFLGDNNPAKREDVRKKISEKNKGKESIFKGKKHSLESRLRMSIGAKNRKISEEGRRKLSEARKNQYNGNKKQLKDWTGCTHTEETKLKMSKTAKQRKKKQCEHCEKLIAVNIYSRFHGLKCKHKEDYNANSN